MKKSQSSKRTTAATLVFAVVITIAAKMSAFLRDVVLSFYFGVGPATDAYFIANLVPGLAWLAVLATISTVFLPYYTEVSQRSVGARVRLAHEATQIYLLASVLLAIVCGVFAGQIVHLTAPAANASTLSLARELTLIMAVGFLFTGYVGLQNAIQQAHGQFLPPLAAPLANNLISIAAICLAGWAHSIRLAAIGSVLGWVVQAPLQRFGTLRYHPARWGWHARIVTVRRLSALAAPAMLGTLLDQVNIYVGIAVAGRIGGGAISHLNYAARLATFLATSFSWFVSYFLFPRLATFAARRNDDEVGRTLTVGVFLIVAFTAPVLVIAIGFKQTFVGIVYGHGAFTAHDISATAAVFGFYAWAIIFIAVREMFNRVFFSFQRTIFPLIFGIVALVVNAISALMLSRQMGVMGVAIAAVLSALVYASLQIIAIAFWKRRLIQHELVRLIGILLVGIGACVGTVTVVRSQLLEEPGIVQFVFTAAVAAIVYGAVVFVGLAMTGFDWKSFSETVTSGTKDRATSTTSE